MYGNRLLEAARAAVDRVRRREEDRDALGDAVPVVDAVPERAGGEGKNGVAGGDPPRDGGASGVRRERVARVDRVLVVEAEGTRALTAAAQRHLHRLGRRDREIDHQVLYFEPRAREGRLGQLRRRRRRKVREAVVYGRRRGRRHC